MPWVQTTDALILCGKCVNTMEKYAISRRRADIVFMADRCTTCRTQFNYKPMPTHVPFGTIPRTGDIKWEVKHEKENKKDRRPRRKNHRVLGQHGIRAPRGHAGRANSGQGQSHRKRYDIQNQLDSTPDRKGDL